MGVLAAIGGASSVCEGWRESVPEVLAGEMAL